MVAAHLTTSDSATSLDRTPSNAGYMAPYNFPRKYSALTKPRWICFALFLFFAIPALGLAIDVCQKTPQLPDHSFEEKPPPPGPQRRQFIPATPDRVVVWSRFPVAELCITSAAIMLSWILDVWYPLTFISKPRGEVCYFLVVLAMHTATIVFTVSFLPGAIEWLKKTEFSMHTDNVNGEVLAMTACMVIQSAVLLGLCVIITWSTIQHIRDGRRDALYHPTCRFDPNAPSPVAMLGVHHQSMHRIPQSSYTPTTNSSALELCHLPSYSYSSQPPSQEFHQENRLDNRSHFV